MKCCTKNDLKWLFVFLIAVAINNNANALHKPDSTKIREVQVSQQRIVTEVSHIKGQKTVKYKAKLKGVFKVVAVSNDKQTVELDWALCPDAGCPVMATYYAGTKTYNQLDAVIANARKNEAKIKQLANLTKTKPRINETYTERL